MKQVDNQGYYGSEHLVQFLPGLLKDIRKGNIQIPKYQRPLVLTWEDRLELFRSVRDGIPMGTVMIWRTSEQKLECYENPWPFQGTLRQ